MNKELKADTRSWIREHSEKGMNEVKLLELHRIMRQIVSDWGERIISDSEALDMLLTLNCFSNLVESLRS